MAAERFTLQARDPRTYRVVRRAFATGWDLDTDPDALARYTEALAMAIAHAWYQRFGVAMPYRRVEWSVSR